MPFSKYRMPNAIEKYKSPVGDGNLVFAVYGVSKGIEKYKSPGRGRKHFVILQRNLFLLLRNISPR